MKRRERRRRMCLGKRTYRTSKIAWDMAIQMNADAPVFASAKFEAYPCPYGRHFHVGHARGR